MALQPDPALPGFFYPSSLTPVAPHVYATDGLDEDPPGSHLYLFETGDYAYPSLVPVPHTEMTIFDLDDRTITITVYRTAKGRTMPVRGQIGVYAVGGVNVTDWEAPFGVPLTYQAQQFDADGTKLGYTRPFTTQLDVDGTWVHNVFNPASAVPVTPAGTAFSSLKRSIPGDLYWASGSGVATAISGQRRGLEDVDVSFLTFDLPTADKVDLMFGDPYASPSVPPVLCIRTGAKQRSRLPQPFFAYIPDPTQVPLDLANGGELIRWECAATEVAPPAAALVTSVLTYDDIDGAYATYAAMDAAYSTYLERDRDYSLVGRGDDGSGGGGTGGGVPSVELYGEGVYGQGIFGS